MNSHQFWNEVKRKYLNSLEHSDLISSYMLLNTILDNYQETD